MRVRILAQRFRTTEADPISLDMNLGKLNELYVRVPGGHTSTSLGGKLSRLSFSLRSLRQGGVICTHGLCAMFYDNLCNIIGPKSSRCTSIWFMNTETSAERRLFYT